KRQRQLVERVGPPPRDQDGDHHRRRRVQGRRRPGGRHPIHERHDRGGQELREDTLHRTEHLLLRRRHGGRHGEDHRAHLEPDGAPADEHRGGQSRVVTACTLLKRMLFRYQGYVSAALVLGGVDHHGPHLYQIYPHGSTGKLPYTTMGSGSLAAMAVFEADFRDDMTEDEAVKLVQRAILAGIFNDLGSGSNVDTCVIRSDGSVRMGRNDITPNEVGPLRESVRRSDVLNMRPGTTAVLGETFVRAKGLGVTLADVTVSEMET
ncbi:hypothetical protein THAOC_19555, partial [Thalassiosira oceanica]